MAKRKTERRKYIRLDSVFPVDFRLVAQDGQTFLSDWLQGFTNNISKGGICLTVNNLKLDLAELIRKGEAGLLLNIQIPLSSRATPARTKPIWIEPVLNQPGQYLIGLSYTQISAAANKRIVGYAWTKFLIPRFAAVLLIILALAIGVSGYFNWRLTRENRNLVRRLVEVAEESKSAQEDVNRINREKEELNSRIAKIQTQINNAEGEKERLSEKLSKMELAIEKREAEERALRENTQRLSMLLEQLREDRNALQKELLELKEEETQAVKSLSVIDEKKIALQQATFDNMYQWLVKHQNPRTGLILSFEGDQDVANWAFTYDQSLVACAFTYSGDFQKAQNIFDFYKYKAEKIDGAFLNAYYAKDGQPAEYVVHSGPNIWLGIAILQYTKQSGDNRYLDLARGIADWVMRIQDEDAGAGIRGGPRVEWYATEHNLDAYVFFNMLYKITGEQHYEERARKVLSWLVKHTYDRPDIPVKRGKGDSTIATDTYAWSIAAIGPAKLEEIGMQPDDVMKFAEENCRVEVNFRRPDNTVIKVTGFDFAAQRNLARGGVVSTEWTAQMILSFKIMARYYREKQERETAQIYQNKARDYLWQLSRMIISSPSPSGQGRGCLPYASADFVDTGHGWMTPKGSSTGSVSGTAYTLFAYYGWNPLGLN
ncbi:MAG: hypothetical protein ABIH40_05300 [Candidatus Omnitrophota bacterium]